MHEAVLHSLFSNTSFQRAGLGNLQGAISPALQKTRSPSILRE